MIDKREFIRQLKDHPFYKQALEMLKDDAERKRMLSMAQTTLLPALDALNELSTVVAETNAQPEIKKVVSEKTGLPIDGSPVSGSAGA